MGSSRASQPAVAPEWMPRGPWATGLWGDVGIHGEARRHGLWPSDLGRKVTFIGYLVCAGRCTRHLCSIWSHSTCEVGHDVAR